MCTAIKPSGETAQKNQDSPVSTRPESAPAQPAPRRWVPSRQQLLDIGIVCLSLGTGILLWHMFTAIDLDFFINFSIVYDIKIFVF